MHRNGQMVSKVMRTGPRRQNKAVKQQGPRSEVGQHESKRTADSDPAAISVDGNLIPSGESQLHLDDSPVGITDSVIISQLAMNQDVITLTNQAPFVMQHSTTSPSPGSVDRDLNDSLSPGSASAATSEMSNDAGISHQNNKSSTACNTEVSDLQNHLTVSFASSSAETEATVLPAHCGPEDFFVDDAISDSWLRLEDSNDEETSDIRITVESETTNRILSRISGTPSVPSSIPDPFDDYLFCHYMQNLSLCLYPMRPDCNPYRDIYGDLAVRSHPLRNTILFASASHLVNLGRLPKFALQPYRKAMRVAFREGIAIETDLEGLAATALLSVVFDVIDTGLDTWSTRLLGCRRLLRNAMDKSNGTNGRFLQ
ncbi:Fungal transcription factor [Fusarium oxysporum f. sp. vasinfectum]|nr:Fungal transcription factor [Fusarium oxysporum f. sp. vasinfectum]